MTLMPFYGFKLNELHIFTTRGRRSDNDIVTFSVLVNQRERGAAAGLFTALAPGSRVPAAAVRASTVRGAASRDFVVGPLEIRPDDLVDIVFTGVRVSDQDVGDDQAKVTLKILDKLLGATVGAVAGPVGAVAGAVLGFVSNPAAKILGFEPNGPCDGVVFSDVVSFTGAGLDTLAYGKPAILGGFLATLPRAEEARLTRSRTGDLHHDKETCGDVARTDIEIGVIRVPSVSVLSQNKRLFRRNLRDGLRQMAADPPSAHDLKRLLRVRA